jgi:hypothetical protein
VHEIKTQRLCFFIQNVFVEKTGSMAPIPSRADNLRDGQHVEQHELVVELPYLLALSKHQKAYSS